MTAFVCPSSKPSTKASNWKIHVDFAAAWCKHACALDPRPAPPAAVAPPRSARGWAAREDKDCDPRCCPQPGRKAPRLRPAAARGTRIATLPGHRPALHGPRCCGCARMRGRSKTRVAIPGVARRQEQGPASRRGACAEVFRYIMLAQKRRQADHCKRACALDQPRIAQGWPRGQELADAAGRRCGPCCGRFAAVLRLFCGRYAAALLPSGTQRALRRRRRHPACVRRFKFQFPAHDLLHENLPFYLLDSATLQEGPP